MGISYRIDPVMSERMTNGHSHVEVLRTVVNLMLRPQKVYFYKFQNGLLSNVT